MIPLIPFLGLVYVVSKCLVAGEKSRGSSSSGSSDNESSSDSSGDSDAWGGFGDNRSTSSHDVISRDFDPSDSAGDAFRGVFGDDNT